MPGRMLLAFFGVSLAFTSPLVAQGAMELNRTGRWDEAADVAIRGATDPTIPLAERCEDYYSLIYAQIRLVREAEAAEHLAEFDRLCVQAVAGIWVETEVNRLRAELEFAPPSRNDDWETVDLARIGADVAAFGDHLRLCELSAADACLVVHDGRIVQEWYGPNYREPMHAMSSTKSVSGILAGLLMSDGRFDLDDPVSRFIPEWRAGAEAGVTVRHLLTMTSGLPYFPPDMPEVGTADDKEAFVFGLDLAARPGETWAYSNDGVFLLSPLFDRAAGEPIEEYAVRRLFEPLGMRNTRLNVYPKGQAWTHADMKTTPRDLARIGQLMLQRGRWGNEQVVPSSWVEALVQPSQDLNPAYGLLWWLNVPEGYAARGYLDTNVYVLPERDLVVVRMQSRPSPGAEPYEPAAFALFERLVPQ